LKTQLDHDLGRGRCLVLVSLLLFAMVLASCSTGDWDIKPRASTVKPVEATANKPTLPYSQIDYDYPLSSLFHPKLYVYKSERRLLVVEDDILVRDYHVALGPHPNGDKFMRGDGRTPEGDFYVCVKKPDSQYYKSLGLSYPSPKHAEEAVSSGEITPRELSAIEQAYATKTTPPWNTPLGGAIFIHGGGAGEDWTLGCVALNNTAMDELFDAVPVGTPVKILP
jgi:murein L,D-transpeptidase YafK